MVAQLGTSDHLSFDSWRPVTVAGRPVRVERSFSVERPSGTGRRAAVNIPFVLALPPVELARGSSAWRLSVAGERLMLPYHYRMSGDAHWDPIPAGDLFPCRAATVANGRLCTFAAHAGQPMQLGATTVGRWRGASRLVRPFPGGRRRGAIRADVERAFLRGR